MGLNIAGFVIDKNYENDISELEDILSAKLNFKKEIVFEEAIRGWKNKKTCDIHFTLGGTLVFFAPEYSDLCLFKRNQNTLTFCLSEMAMIFIITYIENGKPIRAIMESEGITTENEGIPLEFEKIEDDKSELIYHLIEKILGISFFEIDNEAKCNRYDFKSNFF